MKVLRQSTVADIILGQFTDDTDGKTPETALTIAQADVQLMKNGGTAAQKNDATSATHRVNGMYKIDLNATDTDTVGSLDISVKVAGALGVWEQYQVLEEATYDSIYGSGATALATEANLNTVGDDTSAILEDTGTTIPNQISALNDVAATEIVSNGPITTAAGSVSNVGVVDTCTTNTDMRGTDNALLASSAPANFSDLAITVTTGLVSVGTNNDKTGYDLNADQSAVTIGTVTTNTDMRGTDGANTVTPPTAIENADTLLNRDWTAVTDSNERTALNALRTIRNKASITGATLTVTKEDDATVAYTATVTSDPNADPITGIDPA